MRMLFFRMKLGSPNNNECQVSKFSIFELRSYPPGIFHLSSQFKINVVDGNDLPQGSNRLKVRSKPFGQ